MCFFRLVAGCRYATVRNCDLRPGLRSADPGFWAPLTARGWPLSLFRSSPMGPFSPCYLFNSMLFSHVGPLPFLPFLQPSLVRLSLALFLFFLHRGPLVASATAGRNNKVVSAWTGLCPRSPRLAEFGPPHRDMRAGAGAKGGRLSCWPTLRVAQGLIRPRLPDLCGRRARSCFLYSYVDLSSFCSDAFLLRPSPCFPFPYRSAM